LSIFGKSVTATKPLVAAMSAGRLYQPGVGGAGKNLVVGADFSFENGESETRDWTPFH
jgi:hypothetical protein